MMEYLLGSPKDFHDFVNGISKEDKIRIITHTDLDGLASGIFLQKILESKGLEISSIDFLNYGSDILKNYSKEKDFEVLFLTDWNADNDEYGLNELRKKGNVLVFDHHPINENLGNKKGIIKTESKYCSAHALFDLAKNYFDTKNLEWLVCAAIILDYAWDVEENLNFLKSIYPEIVRENINESEPGKIGGIIGGALIYYKPDYKKVYNLVLKEDFDKLGESSSIIQKEVKKWIDKFKNEAEYFPEQNLYFYYGTPKYGVTPPVSTILSEFYEGSTIIFLKDKGENLNQIGINSRNQSGKVKLGDVLKKCIKGFENSVAGGHDKAAGGDFPKRYLPEFKKRLLEELK